MCSSDLGVASTLHAQSRRLAGTRTRRSKTACARRSRGTSPIARLPKPRRADVSLPPPQLPPPDPQRDLPRVPFELRRPSRRFNSAPPFVASNLLIAVNVGIFIWMTLGEVGSVMFGSTESDRTMNFVISRAFLEQGEWYRLVSCGFVHFGVIHVGFNMLLLYQLGRLVEPVIGPFRFSLLYFASLLGGSLGALLLSPNAATGGASGAVFGLMAASVVGVGQRGVNPLRTGLGVKIGRAHV